MQLAASLDPSQGSSRAIHTLFAIRGKVGERLGWDGADAGVGSRVPTLRDRLPVDLRDAPIRPAFDALPFTPLYMFKDEWAAEIANRTVHGVMHLGWVPDQTGGYRGQMAVLVKPNGRFGTAYMVATAPDRVPGGDARVRADLAEVQITNRDTAIELLDRLQRAQNEFYAGGSGAALEQLLA